MTWSTTCLLSCAGVSHRCRARQEGRSHRMGRDALVKPRKPLHGAYRAGSDRGLPGRQREKPSPRANAGQKRAARLARACGAFAHNAGTAADMALFRVPGRHRCGALTSRNGRSIVAGLIGFFRGLFWLCERYPRTMLVILTIARAAVDRPGTALDQLLSQLSALLRLRLP